MNEIEQKFQGVFDKMDDLKSRMRECKSDSEWDGLREEFKTVMSEAKKVYGQYSTDEKWKNFYESQVEKCKRIHDGVKYKFTNETHYVRFANGYEVQLKPDRNFVPFPRFEIEIPPDFKGVERLVAYSQMAVSNIVQSKEKYREKLTSHYIREFVDNARLVYQKPDNVLEEEYERNIRLISASVWNRSACNWKINEIN